MTGREGPSGTIGAAADRGAGTAGAAADRVEDGEGAAADRVADGAGTAADRVADGAPPALVVGETRAGTLRATIGTSRARSDRSGPSSGTTSWTALLPSIAGATAFRFACYAAMTALALWGESTRGPTLHDALVSRLPYVPWIDRVNYVAWLAVYLPLALVFLASEPRRWVRYMITGGLVSLARGVCIAVTVLGAPDPAHAGPGVGDKGFWQAWIELLSPIDVFAHDSARAYLTQDLFFSGHAATTFLLVLYLWHRPRLRVLALVAHVLVVATVMLSHLHYTIDVIGAWAFTFAIFALREWRPGRAAVRAA